MAAENHELNSSSQSRALPYLSAALASLNSPNRSQGCVFNELLNWLVEVSGGLPDTFMDALLYREHLVFLCHTTTTLPHPYNIVKENRRTFLNSRLSP